MHTHHTMQRDATRTSLSQGTGPLTRPACLPTRPSIPSTNSLHTHRIALTIPSAPSQPVSESARRPLVAATDCERTLHGHTHTDPTHLT
mmetsp:Transcript_54021/g.135808  ORF Transcript_54021/g.135808 Transcript_54021/m.135808 type:complete len:89 (+) Transcript_54021:72-338(+)